MSAARPSQLAILALSDLYCSYAELNLREARVELCLVHQYRSLMLMPLRRESHNWTTRVAGNLAYPLFRTFNATTTPHDGRFQSCRACHLRRMVSCLGGSVRCSCSPVRRCQLAVNKLKTIRRQIKAGCWARSRARASQRNRARIWGVDCPSARPAGPYQGSACVSNVSSTR